MTVAKMSVQELEKFLHDELAQAFAIGGEIVIESADGQTCMLCQRYRRTARLCGGAVDRSGWAPSPPTSTINFLRKGAWAGLAGPGPAVETR